MPALTKKKTKKRVRSADTGRAAKGRMKGEADYLRDAYEDVKGFARRNKSTLKKLGWVFAGGAMAADAVVSKAKEGKKASTSKGGRGSERERTRKRKR